MLRDVTVSELLRWARTASEFCGLPNFVSDDLGRSRTISEWPRTVSDGLGRSRTISEWSRTVSDDLGRSRNGLGRSRTISDDLGRSRTCVFAGMRKACQKISKIIFRLVHVSFDHRAWDFIGFALSQQGFWSNSTAATQAFFWISLFAKMYKKSNSQ
jgi:hypothetical protein